MPGKRDLTLLFGVRLLSAMGVTLILPVMPAMARTFGLSIAEAGMVVVCFTLAEATMTPVGSAGIRRRGDFVPLCGELARCVDLSCHPGDWCWAAWRALHHPCGGYGG